MRSTVGIDFSSFWLDACCIDRDDQGTVLRVAWARERLRRDRGDSEEVAITNVRHALWSCLGELSLAADAAVFIERGFGASRRSDFLLGCIYGATVAAVGAGQTPWYPMLRGEWVRCVTAAYGVTTKKGAPGNANASKQVANDASLHVLGPLVARGLVSLPAAVDGPAALGPDQLDAFGVAYAGSLR